MLEVCTGAVVEPGFVATIAYCEKSLQFTPALAVFSSSA